MVDICPKVFWSFILTKLLHTLALEVTQVFYLDGEGTVIQAQFHARVLLLSLSDSRSITGYIISIYRKDN